jgi:uncharacterized membrane protein YgcG
MRFQAVFLVVALALLGAQPALAQQPSPPPSATDGSQTSSDQGQQTLTEQELEQLVAPIALYPDPLLAQVLMASTYPLQVVQADRWVQSNPKVTGDALTEAMAKQDWDASVKALVATPSVLDMMNKDLDWTQKLGDAVLAQQADVMDAVQALRAKAQANGKLESNQQQKVTVQDQGSSQQTIVIQPAEPDVVYVPYYNPSVVYGTWPYAAYPPYYFPPAPGWAVTGAFASGLAWSAGFAVGNAIWGDGFNWHNNDIHVNVNKTVNYNNNNFNVNNFNKNNLNTQNWQHKGGDQAGRPGGANNRRPNGLPNKGANDNDRFSDLNSWMKKNEGIDRGRYSGPGGNGGLDNKAPGATKRPGNNPGGLNGSHKGPASKPNPSRPSEPKRSAFDPRDGGQARQFSDRGRASMGARSPAHFEHMDRGGGGRSFHGGGGRRR